MKPPHVSLSAQTVASPNTSAKVFKYYCALENNRVEGDLKLACVAAALVATQRSNEHEKLVELNASSFIFAI